MKILIGTLLFALTRATVADVYKWIAPDGSVVYTDRPLNGAMQLPMPAWHLPAPPPTAPALRQPNMRVMPRVQIDYKGILVEKPRAGQYVREEGQGIEVAVNVVPRLHVKKGHRVQLFLDGEPRGSASPSTTQRITDVGRGPHSIAARVLAPDGRVLIQSRPVNFFYQRPAHAFAAPVFVPTPQQTARAAPRAPRAPIFPRALNVPAMKIVPPPPGP